MDGSLSSSPHRPPRSLNLDVLTCILPFLASSPSTLASAALISSSLNGPATRQLYHSVELKGSPRTYQLFFESHASAPPPPSSPRPSPLTYTNHLYLGRHFLPPSSASTETPPGSRLSTSLYTLGTPYTFFISPRPSLSNLLLPSLPPDLFPHLQTLHLDVHLTHLASILPILIAVNPAHLVLSPHPPSLTEKNDAYSSYSYFFPSPISKVRQQAAIAYLPQLVFSSYTYLTQVTIISTDLHPPDLSDYPPFSKFPFPPSLASLERVKWVYTVKEMRPLAGMFFQNLEGLFDWERELEVVVEIVDVRKQQQEEEDIVVQIWLGKQRRDVGGMLRRSLELVGKDMGPMVVVGEEGEEREEHQGFVEVKERGEDGFEEEKGSSKGGGRWEVWREEVWRFRKVRVRVREVVVHLERERVA